MEMHSCQTAGMAQTFVDISGNDITGGTGMGMEEDYLDPSIHHTFQDFEWNQQSTLD